MIRAKFIRGSGGELIGFEITGHAGGYSGRDPVCAAVSSAAYFAANTLTEVFKAEAEVSVGEGLMSFYLKESGAPACGSLIEGLRIHLAGISALFPKKIFVIAGEK